MVFARLLFPCSKLALKDAAQGTLLAAACGLLLRVTIIT